MKYGNKKWNMVKKKPMIGRKTKIGMRSPEGPRKDVGKPKSRKDFSIRNSRKTSAGIKIKRLSAGGSREDVRN